MKVLLVSAYFPVKPEDHARSFVRDEAFALSDSGVQVHVARWRYAGRLFSTKDSVVNGVHVHGLKLFSPKNFLFGFSDLWSLPISLYPSKKLGRIWVFISYGKQLEKIVRHYDIDIIHAHFAYPEGFISLMTRKRIGKPLVVTLHGADILVEPRARYGYRLDSEVDRITRMVLKEADKVVAASSVTYKTALEVGCSSNNIVLIQNAVDVKRFSPVINRFRIRDRLGINKKPVIFTVRAHEPQKGIEYLIRAVPLVLEKVPDAIFIIGGDGSLRSFHESLARQLGVSASIIFTGRIPESELPQFYAACDVFVIPSIVEAFGLVTTEAMACGKPVIGTDVGGIPDIIEDGVTGFLVRPRDPVALAQEIILILENSELGDKMGMAGRKSVEKKFNIKERAEKIIKLYDSLF